MTLVHCPYCGTKVMFARGGSKNRPITRRPYCSACGWNIPFVEKGVTSLWRWTTLTIFGFGIFVVTQILILMATHPPIRWGGVGVVLGFAAIWVLVAFVLPYRKYKKDLRDLADLRAAVEAGAKTGESRGGATPVADAATMELFDLIRSTPRPRPVHPNPMAQIAVYVSRGFALAYALGAIRILISPIDSLGASRSRLLASGILALAFILWFTFSVAARRESRLDLLTDGEVALARVLSRKSSKIVYEFSDASGRVIPGRGKDVTGSVQEGVYIPVFYDPRNPEDRVALCASWYEIDAPGSGSRARPWLTRQKPL
jgi:uncharacterized protein (DUF983 family)